MYKVIRDTVFVLLALFLTASTEQDAQVLDCNCLAQSITTVQGDFTTDDVVCIPKGRVVNVGQEMREIDPLTN